GGITMSLFASDESKDHVELRVDDTGIGIAAKELPRLFQRFHRVKGARSRSDEGTGIGLALVRALVTLHGGDVSVVSREGLGSSSRAPLRRGGALLAGDRIPPGRAAVKDGARVGDYAEEAMRWSDEPYAASENRSLDIGESGESPSAAPGPRARVLVADSN